MTKGSHGRDKEILIPVAVHDHGHDRESDRDHCPDMRSASRARGQKGDLMARR